MYLLKHICIRINSACNQLIVTLLLTTSACLFSHTTSGAEINAGNGHVNTNIFYFNANKCNGGAC
jgi:hypothetical protein